MTGSSIHAFNPWRTFRELIRRGDQMIWLSGGALALALLMIVTMLVIVFTNGFTLFWPHRVVAVDNADGTRLLGVATASQAEHRDAGGRIVTPSQTQLKVGNRELHGFDYVWVKTQALSNPRFPVEVVQLERQEHGDFLGFLHHLEGGGRTLASGEEAWDLLLDLQSRKVESDGRNPAAGVQAVFTTIDGQEKKMPLAAIVRAFRPNAMTTSARIGHFVDRMVEFVVGQPRESNTEGGVFPAIFGTVVMTMIMCVVVTPLGVIAALYMSEYAGRGLVIRLMRIAINNLAGVPSIVFGVFGLGFFVYFIGGGIDRLFFFDELPVPTFGTGGILWASLTLALLTVPVVIVATEESIAAVPRGAREASLALGASRLQTMLRIVLPASVPGIITGVILAVARGAGEVAPLMLTGVVKLAPALPLDARFPFLHLDRKFMHLGFHIYDVGFQSPNVEASKSMVFATTLLLIIIVLCLNLAGISLRSRLRRKHQVGIS